MSFDQNQCRGAEAGIDQRDASFLWSQSCNALVIMVTFDSVHTFGTTHIFKVQNLIW
jgi:hypothetical protein